MMAIVSVDGFWGLWEVNILVSNVFYIVAVIY